MFSTQHIADSTQKTQAQKTCLLLVAIVLLSTVSVSAAERRWTREEILAIADKETQQVGYRAEGWGVSLDFYNSAWTQYAQVARGAKVKGDVVRQAESKLGSRSYWAVNYRSPLNGAAKTAGLFVFIDRISGEVIGSFDDSKWQEGLRLSKQGLSSGGH